MQHLGTGLSVDSLCKACEITYNDLCILAQEYADLMSELKKWYKRYDFIPQCEKLEVEVAETTEEDNSLETKDNSESKPKRTRKKVV